MKEKEIQNFVFLLNFIRFDSKYHDTIIEKCVLKSYVIRKMYENFQNCFFVVQKCDFFVQQ